MKLQAPQPCWIVLMAISLICFLRDHGKPKTGHDNFWTALVAVVINASLLAWGGFFG